MGAPRVIAIRAIAWTTCSPLMPWSTSITSASRVNALTTVNALRRRPSNNASKTASGERATLTVRETVSELTQRWRSVGGIAVYITMQAIALHAFMLWSAGVMQRTYGWSPREIGLTMGSVVLIGGCLGMFVGVRRSDRWLAAGRRDAAVRVAMVSSTLGPLLPGLLNDYIFHDERAIGKSLALTLTVSTLAAALVYAWTRPHYRRDH